MREIPVLVIGSAGRLGSFACHAIEEAEGLELTGGIEAADDLVAGLQESGARVALDVTVAGLGLEHGLAILDAGLRPVIGTSGVGEDDTLRLDERARALGLGGIVVPNFCLGAWLLERLAREAVRYFPEVEIVEEHHMDKVDAPSGTAAQLARVLEGEAGEARGGRPVSIHSLRLPGLHSNHVLRFGGTGESLTLRHDTQGLEAFGPGLLAALRYADLAEGVVLGMDAVLA
jgi:4-hydroxy-tetrahydrodipicolinate reductase